MRSMIGRPRSQYCQIKDILYPDTHKPIKNLMSQNLDRIKLQQEKNRIKKEQKENYIPRKNKLYKKKFFKAEPYKMKEFKNIPSKIFQHTEKWVKNEKEVTKNKYGENPNLENEINKIKKRPMSSTSRSVQPRITINFNKEDPSKKLSMFEEYYKKRLIEEKILPNPEEEKKYEELEEIKDNYDHELKEIKHIQNIEEQMNAQYESIKKAQLKEATPSSKDLGMILPKTPRNYIKENKNLIHEQKVPNKVKPEKQSENPYHKNYGKTPLYIKNMRIEAEIRKEIAQQKKIESKYPKGTRLLSEEERQKTLSGLYESQKEIMDLIEKLPISMGTRASKAKKDELYRKLDEIEEAIKTFSRDQVFVKIDS